MPRCLPSSIKLVYQVKGLLSSHYQSLHMHHPYYLYGVMIKTDFCLCEKKGADQPAKLISAFVFSTRIVQYEPRCEKTGLRGFRPGPIQTGLYKLRKELEA